MELKPQTQKRTSLLTSISVIYVPASIHTSHPLFRLGQLATHGSVATMNQGGPTKVKCSNRHIAAPTFTKQDTVVANRITKNLHNSSSSSSSGRTIKKAQSSDGVYVLNENGLKTQMNTGADEDPSTTAFPPLDGANHITYDRYCGPTPESNWVVPGMLLVGAYPASQDDNETVMLITSILKQGVTKFVCLQEEYRSHGVTENMWRQGHALRPYFDDVRRIVDMKDQMQELDGCQVVDLPRLSFVHFPIRDCGITDDGRVLELAKSLVTAMANGEVLYLHCWGGHGRTGTLVCIILHLMYGLEAMEAMAWCQKVHDLRQFPVAVGSPQTQTQRDQVIRVINRLLSSSDVPIRRTISDLSSLHSGGNSPLKKSPRPTLSSGQNSIHVSNKDDDDDDNGDGHDNGGEGNEQQEEGSGYPTDVETSAALVVESSVSASQVANTSTTVITASSYHNEVSALILDNIFTEQGDSNIQTTDNTSNINAAIEQFIEYYADGDIDQEGSNLMDRNRSKSGAMDIDGNSFIRCRSVSGAMDICDYGDNINDDEEGEAGDDENDAGDSKQNTSPGDAEAGEQDDGVAAAPQEARQPESVVPLKPEREKPSTLFGFRRGV